MTTAKAKAPCQCSRFTIPTEGATIPKQYAPFVTKSGLNTRCKDTTGRTFAQGHDARLAGLLIFAHRGGLAVVEQDGGMRVERSAEQVAAEFGPGFAAKVTAPAKTPAKTPAKPAPKAAAKKAAAPRKSTTKRAAAKTTGGE